MVTGTVHIVLRAYSRAENIANEMPSTCLTPRVCVACDILCAWNQHRCTSFRCQACTHAVKGIFRAIEIALASFIALQHFHLSMNLVAFSLANYRFASTLCHKLHTHIPCKNITFCNIKKQLQDGYIFTIYIHCVTEANVVECHNNSIAYH